MLSSEVPGKGHVIRLHGPWELQQCGIGNAECGIEPTQTRVKVPLELDNWLDPEFRGTVVLERAFGLPTNLDEQQSVRLTVQTDQLVVSSISLNQTELPTSASILISGSDQQVLHRHDVTSLLKARNRLRLTLAVDAQPSGSLPYVAIEIFG